MKEHELLEESKKTNSLLDKIFKEIKKEKVSVIPVTVDRDRYYDVFDMARMFNVSQRTIYKWSQLGKLPKVKFFGRLLFPRKEIDDLLAKTQTAGKDWYEEFMAE